MFAIKAVDLDTGAVEFAPMQFEHRFQAVQAIDKLRTSRRAMFTPRHGYPMPVCGIVTVQ